jgi:streptogramin lyase
MKRNKLTKFILTAFILFFVIAPYFFTNATEYKTVPSLLTTFSNGSSTFDISFPPGGGTNSDAKVLLPQGTTIFSASVDMVSAGGSEIGTPYIWVPLSDNDGLVQIRTSNGTIVRTFSNSDPNCSFDNPSRITVIPGGDVWVDNRNTNTVTRLGLIDPATSMEDYECKGNYAVDNGGSQNGGGVTYDMDGNVWVGSYGNNNIYKFSPDGTALFSKDIGYKTYGMIADSKGNVWISTGNNDNVVKINKDDCDGSSCPVTVASGFNIAGSNMAYGIGIDNEEDIWVGETNNGVHEIDNSSTAEKQHCDTADGLSGCCTGVAVDKTNNVWASGHDPNTIYVIKEGDCGQIFSKANVCTNGNRNPHGVAIDFDNNAWVICKQGEVIKYSFDGTNINELQRIDLSSYAGTSNNATYNYSDMTGLRTIPKKLIIGGNEFAIDGTTFSGFESQLQTALSSCTPVDSLNCEIPLEIFSVTGGDYTLQNLKISYGKLVPITIGGLVPCGREDDDGSTPWVESDPCTFCHLILMTQLIIEFLVKLAGIVAMLAIALGGLLYIFSAGNQSRMESAKTGIKYALIGFVIIFIAWAVVGTLLAMLGYIDPLNGEWYVVNC